MLIRVRTIVIGGVLLAGAVLTAAAAFVYFRGYNVAATSQHTSLVYHFLRAVMLRSVAARADSVAVPDLRDPDRALHGASLYRQHCLQCHGAPGVSPDDLGFGTRPEPPNLLAIGSEWPAARIHWVIRHGLKMTAMPAWEYRLSDAELWDLTAFVQLMPTLSPAQYRQLGAAPFTAGPVAAVGASADERDAAAQSETAATGIERLGDAKAGRVAIEQYLCITCHSIPGVIGADKTVGTPLAGIATRSYIAGTLPNTPANMLRWLRDPQRVKPQSAMPNLHIREIDLRDIAAYLYTLERPDRP